VPGVHGRWSRTASREGRVGDPTNDGQPGKPGATVGIGVTIAVGAGLGLIFGLMLDSLALGLAVGAGLGTVVGAILESNRRRS
jgi:hypothetical protein